jgi:hypothetical protein
MRISIKQFNRAVIDQVSMALHRMDSGNVDTVLIEVIR